MIWFVDDDPDELFLVKRALLRLRPSLSVVLFENHEDALKAILNECPSILVSDLNMPGMDGISFFAKVEEILEQRSQIPPQFLLITAAIPNDIQARMTCLRHQVQVITKPDFPQDLAKDLVSLLPKP